ncbi:MAG: tetratricopeptide repeat protein [Flavobacteriaceae bacterium]|nr:tetratricopeptide repeat protein [Flavobacteriaceae bacterium]
MKKQIFIVGLALISAVTFAQKKEIKKAEKAVDSQKFDEAMAYLKEAESLLGAADNLLKAQYYTLLGETALGTAGTSNFAKMKDAGAAFLKAEELSGKKDERLTLAVDKLRVALVNSAIEDQNKQSYLTASQKLYQAYMVSPKDTSYLYYAAGNSVNGKDYDTALGYYEQLIDLGFTNVHMEYSATNPETGQPTAFASKEERDNMVKFASYTNPKDEKISSVEGDLLQKVTLIYMNKGQNEKALAVMNKARAANPDDVNLMRSEADLAYKMGDMEKYNKIMADVIKTDPNNPELYYNLGVSSASIGQKDKAKEYYLKALEIKPDYSFAQINMAALILQDEGKLVEEMNGLGNSRADNLKYDELKEKRNMMYQEALPYLEGAVSSSPENVEVLRTLMNLYSQLAMDDKYKAAKAKLAEKEGN